MSRDGSFQVVVGVDGSDAGGRALAWAVDEARAHDGEVTAVFAWQTPLIGVPGAFDRGELERQAQQLLAAEVGSADNGVPITQLVAEGDPAESLVAACEQHSADMLVLGTRGLGGVSNALFGSVGLACLARAPCPVLLVKDQVAQRR